MRSPQSPTAARLVHYALPRGPQEGVVRPAVVIQADAQQRCQLHVFLDVPTDAAIYEPWAKAVPFDATGAPGTWRWPPRDEPQLTDADRARAAAQQATADEALFDRLTAIARRRAETDQVDGELREAVADPQRSGVVTVRPEPTTGDPLPSAPPTTGDPPLAIAYVGDVLPADHTVTVTSGG